MCMPLKSVFSRHEGDGVQITDEPTGALDSRTGKEILALFQELNDMGNTIIMITHDLKVAQHSKQIAHLADGVLLVE